MFTFELGCPPPLGTATRCIIMYLWSVHDPSGEVTFRRFTWVTTPTPSGSGVGGNAGIMRLCLPVTKTDNDEKASRSCRPPTDTLQRLHRSVTPPEMIRNSLCWRRRRAPQSSGGAVTPRYTAD